MNTFFSFCLKKWDRLVLIGLLLLHVLLCAFFLRHNYLTVDEPVHITGGLEILQNMGHTVNPESGVLPQVVTALPLLARVDMPPELTMEKRLITPYPYARYVLYDVAECQESDFFFARLIMVSFSLLACMALWLITRKAGGRIPALLVVALYVFMPLFVSNAPLSTADMASSCFFLTTLLTCHLLLRRCQFKYWLLFFLSCGALLFSKMSAVSIQPIILIMMLVKTFTRDKFIWRIPFAGKTVFLRRRKQRFLAGCAVFLLTGLCLYGAVWAVYGFKSDFPEIPPKALAVRDYQNFADNCRGGFVPDTMKFMGNHKILPRTFVYGFLHTYHFSRKRWSFLDGKTSMYGFKHFFPLVFLYKTPAAVVLALLAACCCIPLIRKNVISRARIKLLFPYLLFGLYFFGMAVFSKLNIGYRHLMPSILQLLPLTALGFRYFMERFKRTESKHKKLLFALPLLLPVWNAWDSMRVFPHSLAYFNPLFGSNKDAYQHICDSSLDWGQDILNIKPILQKHQIPLDGSVPIYLTYFGSVSDALAGLPNARLHPFSTDAQSVNDFLYDFEPGYYLISNTCLQGYHRTPVFAKLLNNPSTLLEFMLVYYETAAQGGIDPGNRNYEHVVLEIRNFQALRHEILRQYIRKMPPLFQINYSINCYYLTEQDLQASLRDLRQKKNYR